MFHVPAILGSLGLEILTTKQECLHIVHENDSFKLKTKIDVWWFQDLCHRIRKFKSRDDMLGRVIDPDYKEEVNCCYAIEQESLLLGPIRPHEHLLELPYPMGNLKK